MNTDVLTVEGDGGVITLWMNRPEKRNALNGELVEALTEALATVADDPDARVVALRGRGPDFCAGADLADLKTIGSQGPEASLADARRLGALLIAMRRHPRPIVGVVHGRALAGGCGLATGCDLVLAEKDAHFGYPEVHLGFVPAMVMALLRLKVTESRAFDLVIGGRRVTADQARELGLVNHVFEVDAFEASVAGFLADLERRPPGAVTRTKALLYELAHLPFEEGIERGAQVNVEARLSDECQAGVQAFLERKKKGKA
jgi:methylglutaconyl-CoA hydratase